MTGLPPAEELLSSGGFTPAAPNAKMLRGRSAMRPDSPKRPLRGAFKSIRVLQADVLGDAARAEEPHPERNPDRSRTDKATSPKRPGGHRGGASSPKCKKGRRPGMRATAWGREGGGPGRRPPQGKGPAPGAPPRTGTGPGREGLPAPRGRRGAGRPAPRAARASRRPSWSPAARRAAPAGAARSRRPARRCRSRR